MAAAAFYQEITSHGPAGTDAGSEIKVKIKQRKVEVGNLRHCRTMGRNSSFEESIALAS